jgi:hypothetical protein
MTDEMSYWNGIACFLECARQAKRDAAFPNAMFAHVDLCPTLQTERGARPSRSLFSASSPNTLVGTPRCGARASVPLPTLPNPKSTPDSQINLKIKPKSGRIRPKNKSALASLDISSLPGVPRLIKAIEGYSSLLKPFFKNPFLFPVPSLDLGHGTFPVSFATETDLILPQQLPILPAF